jgi:hypothetical protein
MSERKPVTACHECGGAKLIGRTPCGECRGVGFVPEEREDWRLMGDDCRTVREQMSQGVSVPATALGVTVAMIARMEAGLDDPMPLYRHWFRG